jgi:hypothetical protein
MLLYSPQFLASLVGYLHSEPHQLVPKQVSLKHLPASNRFWNKPLFPEEEYGVFVSVEGLQKQDQEFEHNLHLDLISDHDVQVFLFKLNGETFPLKLWKHFIDEFWVVFLERRYDLKDALPLHPEPCRHAPVHKARHTQEWVLRDARCLLCFFAS